MNKKTDWKIEINNRVREAIEVLQVRKGIRKNYYWRYSEDEEKMNEN